MPFGLFDFDKQKTRDGAIVGGIGAIITQIFNIPILSSFISVVSQNAMSLFTATSIGSSTLAPQVSWLPVGMLQSFAVLAGAVVVVQIVAELLDDFEDRIDGGD